MACCAGCICRQLRSDCGAISEGGRGCEKPRLASVLILILIL